VFVDLVGRLRELRALEDLLVPARGQLGRLIWAQLLADVGAAQAAARLLEGGAGPLQPVGPATTAPARGCWPGWPTSCSPDASAGPRRRQLADQALRLARRVGDPQTVAEVLDRRLHALWDPAGAADRLAAAGDAPGAVMATACHAMLDILRGRFEEAERLAVEVAEAGRRAGVADTERLAGTLRGQVAAERDPSTWPWWPPRPGTRPPRRRCTTRLGPTTTGWWSGVALSPPAGRCRITSACWRSGWGGSTTPSATCRRRSTCRSGSGPCPAWPTAWPPWPTP
jgi:hypothetical protein